MTQRDTLGLGSGERPLRVAIVGSGPAGFYAAEALFKQRDLAVEVDMFERLPAPFGLVRSGVAPDHQRIKQAAKAFERTASNDGFRFVGNVDVGTDITVDELAAAYDHVVFATGSARDRELGVPGEDVPGLHSALSFVGWYNGHPEFVEERFDLSVERAAVIGVGNVAMDVTRTLVRDPDELRVTDIAGYALDALHRSRVREVVVLGRRGPAQAAFTLSELSDIAELDGVQVFVDPQPIAEARRQDDLDSTQLRLLDYLDGLAAAPDRGAARRVRLEFQASPVEVVSANGSVSGVVIEKNALVPDARGELQARGTGERVVIDAGLVLRAIGFFGIAIAGLPFDDKSGVIPNRDGRVIDEDGRHMPGLYVVGWIKRGPRGLIGSNKGDAVQTVQCMLADARNTQVAGDRPGPASIDALLASRGVRSVSFPEWRVLDEMERAAGRELGKVREKFTTVQAMLDALQAGNASLRSA